MSRVVVSGLGVVSPYGAGTKTFWAGLAAGTCAIRPVTLIETEGFRARVAAEVPADVLAGLGVSPRRARADRLGLAAAREAVADAGLGPSDRAEAALVIGAVGGGMLEGETWYWEETRTGRPSPRITALRSILPYTHAETIGWRLGIGGPKETVVMACASGAASIALAADLVRAGVVPLALAGGVDALTRICFMGFNALKLLDPEPCRPFDRDRRGMSIGEAAAFVVLEDPDRCRARGGRVLA
jgi:3-oxoacyl-[acyl-carrier-protein] synthase II